LFLVLGLPLLERLAVDDLAALVLGHRHALLVRRLLHPVGEAIAAEAGEIHQVDVLHVGTAAQVLDQAAIDGGFEFGAGLLVHGNSSLRVKFLTLGNKDRRRRLVFPETRWFGARSRRPLGSTDRSRGCPCRDIARSVAPFAERASMRSSD